MLLYDNLKSAVTQRIGDAIVFNPDLLAFAGHYGYEPRPVAPYRGNEKGRVERAIRDVRESFFAAREWKDLADLNAQAERWCREVREARRHPDDRTLTIAQAFEEERAVLRALPSDAFPVADRVEYKVGKTPYVRFDGNDYSVPHERVRRTLTVVATSDTVRVLDGQDLVATHARSWSKGGRSRTLRTWRRWSVWWGSPHGEAPMQLKRATGHFVAVLLIVTGCGSDGPGGADAGPDAMPYAAGTLLAEGTIGPAGGLLRVPPR